jgi:acyl-CoA thioester hydrolase
LTSGRRPSDATWRFTHSDEIRYSDIDGTSRLGCVALLRLFEDARVAYRLSRAPGLGLADGLAVLVAELKVSCRSAGRYGELVDTMLRPTTLGTSSFRLDFEMRVGARALADGYAMMVLFDRGRGRPARIPVQLRRRLLLDGARDR